MKQKGVTQYRLIQDGIVDTKTLDRLKKNENTTVVTLERICRALDCDISQVVKLEEDDSETGQTMKGTSSLGSYQSKHLENNKK